MIVTSSFRSLNTFENLIISCTVEHLATHHQSSGNRHEQGFLFSFLSVWSLCQTSSPGCGKQWAAESHPKAREGCMEADKVIGKENHWEGVLWWGWVPKLKTLYQAPVWPAFIQGMSLCYSAKAVYNSSFIEGTGNHKFPTDFLPLQWLKIWIWMKSKGDREIKTKSQLYCLRNLGIEMTRSN